MSNICSNTCIINVTKIMLNILHNNKKEVLNICKIDAK